MRGAGVNAARKRTLAPQVYAGLERETSLAPEASQALETARGLMGRISELDLSAEEISWFLAEALLQTAIYERRENRRREARAVSAALSGARALLSARLQAMADEKAREADEA